MLTLFFKDLIIYWNDNLWKNEKSNKFLSESVGFDLILCA